MRDVGEELRRASDAARTPRDLGAVLERILGELISLDAGMIDGIVVPKPQREDLVVAIGELGRVWPSVDS